MLKQVQHDEIEAKTLPSRHPELISGSIAPQQMADNLRRVRHCERSEAIQIRASGLPRGFAPRNDGLDLARFTQIALKGAAEQKEESSYVAI